MRGVVVDLVFGIALLALGLYLLAQRHVRTAIARERGYGIKSPAVQTAIGAACVLFGIYSIATAFA
jgi:hypothetical protein